MLMVTSRLFALLMRLESVHATKNEVVTCHASIRVDGQYCDALTQIRGHRLTVNLNSGERCAACNHAKIMSKQ